jgi:hypothetical protein
MYIHNARERTIAAILTKINPYQSYMMLSVVQLVLSAPGEWFHFPLLHQNYVIVGTLIGAIGAVAYLLDTIKGKIKPNRVSFLLWSVAPLIAFAAQVKQGVGLESLMTFSTGFLPLMTFIGTFVNTKAKWSLTVFDIWCGALSILGLLLWLVTSVGNIAIMFSIIADGLAAIPTIVKAYHYPDTEIAWPWMATSVGVLLTLMTLSHLTFANSSFIIYIFFLNLLIFILVRYRIGEKMNKGTV